MSHHLFWFPVDTRSTSLFVAIDGRVFGGRHKATPTDVATSSTRRQKRLVHVPQGPGAKVQDQANETQQRQIQVLCLFWKE